MKICPKCGKKFPDEYGFCTECGSKLDGEKGTSMGATDLKSMRARKVGGKSAGTKRGGRKPAKSSKKVTVQPKAASFKVLVDGSNVLYGGGSKPEVKNLQLAIKKLKEEGCIIPRDIQIIVDASMLHRVDDRQALERMISQGTIKQVPAKTSADRWILKYATKHPEYKILSNDMFQDWEGEFPLVRDQNRFIQFMIVGDEVMMEPRGTGATSAGKAELSQPSPTPPLETEEAYTPPRVLNEREPEESVLKPAYAEPIGKPHVERESRGGPETEPSIKTGRGIKATSLFALAAGLAITWASIYAIALPSVLYSVPAEVAKFIPQFSLFIFLAVLGWFLSKKGVEEGPKVFGDVMKYSGLAMILALAAMVLMRWESGFSYADLTFWFRLAYLGAVAVMGAKSFGMRKAGVY